jgi:hypothetical protein
MPDTRGKLLKLIVFQNIIINLFAAIPIPFIWIYLPNWIHTEKSYDFFKILFTAISDSLS